MCTISGSVTGAEVADLNVDGSPEIYVYVTSAGSASHGSLVAYAVNRRKSLSEIYLPPVTQDKMASKGTLGGAAGKAANLVGCKSPRCQLPDSDS